MFSLIPILVISYVTGTALVIASQFWDAYRPRHWEETAIHGCQPFKKSANEVIGLSVLWPLIFLFPVILCGMGAWDICLKLWWLITRIPIRLLGARDPFIGSPESILGETLREFRHWLRFQFESVKIVWRLVKQRFAPLSHRG